MQRNWTVALAAAALVALVAPDLPAAGPAAGGLPPIIDRELIFGDPEISGAELSPDGAFIAFIKPLKGTRNIWVKRTAEPFAKAHPVTADTQSRPKLFADGAGSSMILATLPLAEGYTTTYRNFDLRSQKVKAMELKVAGTERVTVPAGTFDAFKVEVSSADDGSRSTLWVAKDARKVVKSVNVSPQMGGATITSELQN